MADLLVSEPIGGASTGARIDAVLESVRVQNAIGLQVGSAARVMVDRSVFSGHTNAGIESDGPFAIAEINITNSVTSNNGTGIQVGAGANVRTFVAIAAAYGLFMIIKLGPPMMHAATVGPESYTNWQYGAAFDWPFILRDFGALLLIFLAYRVTPWPIALSLALGLIFALAFSFFMRINFACAAIVLGLIFVKNGKKRKSDKFLASEFGRKRF
jgi:hypothetical protein